VEQRHYLEKCNVIVDELGQVDVVQSFEDDFHLIVLLGLSYFDFSSCNLRIKKMFFRHKIKEVITSNLEI
jgi:hypothetical protein